MDESISKLVEMLMAVFLFVFALSSAIFSYSRLNANAEQLIGVNVINRRGTTAKQGIDTEEFFRKTDASEIIFAIYDMEKAANNSGEYTIEVRWNTPSISCILEMNYEVEYSDELDSDGNVVTVATPKIYIKANGANVPGSPFTLDASLSKSDNYGLIIKEFKSYLQALGILDSNYKVSYTSGKLVFTEVD